MGLKEYDLASFNTPVDDQARKVLLCPICASTVAATVYQYPNNFPGRQGDVIQLIAYVGNAIISEIRNKK